MPRHIHDPNAEQPVGRGQLKLRKAQLDRDSAQLFFGQAIGVGAGERTNKRALAVVDVSCRRKDEPL